MSDRAVIILVAVIAALLACWYVFSDPDPSTIAPKRTHSETSFIIGVEDAH